MTQGQLDAAREGVIKAGDGRGFVVQAHGGLFAEPFVITAAHCLPELPPAHPASYTEERTIGEFLGPLGDKPTVWAECMFADPVADIAVLCGPDNQELFKEAEAWDGFVEERFAFCAAMPPAESFGGYVLTLENEWVSCRVQCNGHILNISVDPGAGSSGSPILDENANAVGVVSLGGTTGAAPFGQPCLYEALPGWLTRRLKISG